MRIHIACCLLLSLIAAAWAVPVSAAEHGIQNHPGTASATPFLAALDVCCAVLEDGRLLRWNSPECTGTEPEVLMEEVSAVSGTMWNLLALKEDGTLWTISPSGSGMPPEQVLEGVVQVSAANFHTLAVREDGSLWSWGRNDCGQLGTGGRDEPPGEFRGPQKVLEGVKFAAASETASFAVGEDGSLWYWGADVMSDSEQWLLTPTRLAEGIRFVAPSAQGVLVVTEGGALYELGADTGTELSNLTPLLENVVYCDSALAITGDGALWIGGFLLGEEESGKMLHLTDGVCFADTGLSHLFVVTDAGALLQIPFSELHGAAAPNEMTLVQTGLAPYAQRYPAPGGQESGSPPRLMICAAAAAAALAVGIAGLVRRAKGRAQTGE